MVVKVNFTSYPAIGETENRSHMIQNAYAYHGNVTFTVYHVYHTELISGRNQLYVC